MYKIIFKGRDMEPLMVDDTKGQLIWDAWIAKTKSRMVLGNIAFYTEDVKQIVKVEKTEAEKAATTPNLIEQEYLTFRKKMLSLSVEKRASILRLAKMIWKSHTQDEMPDDLKEQIKARQLVYFTENPKCIYANPKVYRDLIPKFLALKQIDVFKPVQNIIPKVTLRMVESLVQTDLRYSLQ